MKQKLTLLTALMAGATVVSGAVTVMNYTFDSDVNGTGISAASNTGTSSGSWNFDMGKVQDANNVLNYGYTSNWKWTTVDSDTGNHAYRTFTFATPLTTADYTSITLDIDLSKWDLRQNWDPANDSAAAKGIQFGLRGAGNDAQVGFDTQGTTGFRAFATGTGASFSQVNGGDFDNAVNRFEANGGLLRITVLSDGSWTASANDGDGGTFKDIVSGTGLTEIADFRINARSPSIGSWGGAGAGQATDPTQGGTAGDYVLIDGITITAVPESGTVALYAGLAALGLIMWRRRNR
jgi:hypothetical protein